MTEGHPKFDIFFYRKLHLVKWFKFLVNLKLETVSFTFIRVEVVHSHFFLHVVPLQKQCDKAQPNVDIGHFQIIIMLVQGTLSVVSVVKVMVFVGTEIKGT